MPIEFANGWNSSRNHESSRSQEEVARIVCAAPGEVGEAARRERGEGVTVVKGIHQRTSRNTAHIRVEYYAESYHIEVQMGGDGVWQPTRVTDLRNFRM